MFRLVNIKKLKQLIENNGITILYLITVLITVVFICSILGCICYFATFE